ncbi:MAG TPA: hypothetical protein VE465_17915 [Streptosporangiaceae bacterium]|nr:hypothetical protein [Streptosporangiaceae bacterium]
MPGPQPPPPGGRPAGDAAPKAPPPPRRLKRRLIELGAVLILVPAYLGIHWYDDHNNALTFQPDERVTIVPRGAWAKLGHNQWRLLGRQNDPATASAPGSSAAGSTPAGARLTLLLQAKVLDAKGVEELDTMVYELRDRAGNLWSAEGEAENPSVSSDEPPVGSMPIVRVTATVPPTVLTSVVLDLHIQPFHRPERTVLDVLRFAH